MEKLEPWVGGALAGLELGFILRPRHKYRLLERNDLSLQRDALKTCYRDTEVTPVTRWLNFLNKQDPQK